MCSSFREWRLLKGGRLLPSGDGCGSAASPELCLSFPRWLTQKGARQKKINEWLGIKNETEE